MTENQRFEDTQNARSPTKVLRHALVCVAVVLALCLVLTAPAGAWGADTSWYDTNPGADEYVIYTADELAGLAVITNTKHQFDGKTVKLGADIDLGNQEWTPIGIWDDSSEFPEFFAGVFDGQGHTISNLYISNQSLNYVGLFGWINYGARISNLTLENVNVTGTGNSEYGVDVGALAGFVDNMDSEPTLITHCSVIGGTVSSPSEFSCVGGLIGSTRFGPEISNCYAEVTVTGDTVVGGMVGNHNQAADMNNCYAKCTLTGSTTGGLVGFAGENSQIISSYAKSVVNDCSEFGGIIGSVYGGNFTDCFASFDISTSSSQDSVGGIVGISRYCATNITNCYSTGSLELLNSYALPYSENNGGLIGLMSSGSVNIINSVALMQYVDGSYPTGRLAGNENAVVVNSYAWEGMTNNGFVFSEGGMNGTSVSSAQFWNNQSFFVDTLGWDFTNTWKMNSGNENYQLPVLRFMETPVAGDVSYLTSTVVEPDDGSGDSGSDTPGTTPDDSGDGISISLTVEKNPVTQGELLNLYGDISRPSGTNLTLVIYNETSSDEFNIVDWYHILTQTQDESSGVSVWEVAYDTTTLTPGEYFVISCLTEDNEIYTGPLSFTVVTASPTPTLTFIVDKTLVTQGELLNLSGEINFPTGTNLTLVLCNETPLGVQYVVDGRYVLTQSGTSEHSVWTVSYDTTDLDPGRYFFGLQLTDDNTIWGVSDYITVEARESVDRIPAQITITPSAVTINATETVEFTVTVFDTEGAVMDDVVLGWATTMPQGGSDCILDEANRTFTAASTASGDITIWVYPQNYPDVNATAVVTMIPLQASSVQISGPATALEVNEEFTFTAAVKDQLGNSFEATIEWWVDNETVGTIDKGKFTAKAIGQVNVTAGVDVSENGNYVNSTIPVSVVAAAPAGISIEPASASVNCSETVSFTAVVTDRRGNVLSDAPITWSVDTENFGKIDSNGNFTAVSSLIGQDGTVTVTASPTGSPGITATATVSVIGLHATEILLTPTTATLEVGDTTTLTAVVKDQFGNNLDVPVTWTSDTSSVGTVSAGVVTAVQEGTTTITASAGRASNTTEISVIPRIPYTVELNSATPTINATERIQIGATVKDKNGNEIDSALVNWKVDQSNAGFLTIIDGKTVTFTANKTASGMVNITATSEVNESATATIAINIEALRAETLTLTAVPQGTLEVNETFQFTAEVRDQLGNIFDTTVSWESDNTSVGTIGTIGNFTALSIGNANITASVGDHLRVTQQVTVVPSVPHEIIIDPATSVLNASESVKLNVTIKDKRGDIIDSGFTWAKNSDEYGTLADGVFTAAKLIEKNGEIIVTVIPTANESIHANATIKVNGFFATTVTITNKTDSEPVGTAIELNPGQTYAFNATVKDQHGDDFPEGYANLTWKSSKTNVGTIADGIFTAKAVGETTITAQSGNATKTVLIKVFEKVEPKLDDVEIESDPTAEEMTSGKTAVNITVDTSNEKTEVTVDTTKNETTIKDKETNVTLVISFSKMENTTSGNSQSIEGNITAIKAEYPKMNVTASENVSAPVTFQMNLGLKNLTTSLPTVKPVINETKKEQIRADEEFEHHEVGAMVEVDSGINSDLSTAELVFYIPMNWVAKDKLKVLHIKDNDVKSHDSFKVEPDKDGKNWKVTITATGFSAYAVTKDTYVAPSTGDTNKPTYPTGGSSGKTPTTTTPTLPTEEPTEDPTEEPETPDVPGIDTPTEPETPATPAPVAGMILGALAAAAVLRRK